MRERKFGAVVNVASIGAFAPMPLAGHYCSSKAALSQHTETLRLELRGCGHPRVQRAARARRHRDARRDGARCPAPSGFLARMPLGDPDVLAHKIVRGLERGQRALVYPTSLAVARHLPTVALRATAFVTR